MFRILKISAALAVLGAIAGAIGGCVAFALAALGLAPWKAPSYGVSLWFIAGIVAALGGGCGVFVAPVLSWTLLREVPIWRCATETALATSFAGLFTLMLTGPGTWKILAFAVLAAALAVARLKWAFRHRRVVEPDAVT